MLIRYSEQRGWIFFSIAILAVSIFVYVAYCYLDPLGPRGGSWVGLAFGILGLSLMVFCGLLTPRKKLRALPLGKATFWMKGHIWFGLLTLPIILFHSGFDIGGPFTIALMVLLVICYLSGIYGLILQQFLPRLLLSSGSVEMIYERMDAVLESLAESAEALIKKCCGPLNKPLAANLSVLSGPDNGTWVILPELGVFKFGKEAGLPVPITDSGIAPRHFEIRCDKEKYEISAVEGCEVKVNDETVVNGG